MKITEHIYQLSGSCYGTNSSIYALDAGKELILFDAGFTDYQMEVMNRNRKRWGLDNKKITHVFLTHAHMDHAGNAWRFQKDGAKIYVGEKDGEILEKGGLVTLDVLFQREFTCCRANQLVRENDRWIFGGIEVKAVALPGHTAGSMGYLIQDGGQTCFVMGDFVALGLVSPDESGQEIYLSAMIRPGFLEKEYGNSLKKAADLEIDILLPGHLLTYEGDTKRIFRDAYKKYCEEEHQIMELTEKNGDKSYEGK